jgi:hypothetical protein
VPEASAERNDDAGDPKVEADPKPVEIHGADATFVGIKPMSEEQQGVQCKE